MKLRYFFLLTIGGLVFFLGACSTKKDAFVNRNWHALNTRYNVLYNGDLAFEEGRETLNNAYRDNYWEILPVERMQVSEEIRLDSEDNNPNFLMAEEKATKAIQKHSMEVGGQERNPQTDEAFLLLGKARYFDQRYIPALEAFNYVLRKYEKSNKLNVARIWREKTHLRLGYDELALKNLTTLFKYDVLSDQEYADGRAVAAQAYINLQALDTAVQQMKIAAAYTKKTEEKGRYYYIIGQLFNHLEHPDSADMAFDKVIELNRKIPRVYLVNAQLQKIGNVEITSENKDEVREYLTDLEKNRENRPYLDKIYRSLAVYYHKIEAEGAALDYYNKSLRASQNELHLNSLNYTDLAEYYFDQNNYKSAGAYYDSVLLNVPENSRTFRAVSKKRENLDDVITYEAVVKYSDSVLTLASMTPVERGIYFQTHIDSLMADAEAEAVKKEQQTRTGLEAFSQSQGGQENQGKFYFYNVTSLGYGKNEFRMRWGDRELEDNWRWSTKSRILSEITADGDALAEGGEDELLDSEKFSLDFYLDQIPEDPAVLDSLRKERNFANYQLGLIYKEKFKEPMLASARLEAVLDSEPEERLILPSKYNLYKIYQEVGSPLQEPMKFDIIENHPESRYAAILTNPDASITTLQNTQEVRYAELFAAFKAQEYLQVITGTEEAIEQFTGEPIVPKLELLKANAIGRLQGFNQFREALNYIALNYPNTPEGKKAQILVTEQIPKLESTDFSEVSTAEGTSNWKVVFPFSRTKHEKALELKKRLETSISDLNYDYTVSRDIYDLQTEFVVVHGFPSQSYALGYVELLKNNKKYRIANENFVILSDNYKVVQVHKNLADYRNQLQTPKS
ncbi:tetratricopeptide repeat protein [Robiginitalea sp.]|uniref:type IX secretion system periplasmic lipoprotein PorW/SprE n=1 Tax=Robiginitalea sp. TaxID=1902411 RepID=UPI003C78D668